jgi:hypothetical protein
VQRWWRRISSSVSQSQGGGHELITRHWPMAPCSRAWDSRTWGFVQRMIGVAASPHGRGARNVGGQPQRGGRRLMLWSSICRRQRTLTAAVREWSSAIPAWAGGTQRRRSAAARRSAAGALDKHLSPAVCASRSGTGMERRHARMGVGMQRRRSAATRRSAAGALDKHLSPVVCASRSGTGMEQRHARMGGRHAA